MPLALFVIAFLFSSFFSLHLLSLSKEQRFEKLLFEKSAALFTASSHSERSWSESRPKKSLEKIPAFFESPSVLQEELFLNQGIATNSISNQMKGHSDLFFDRYFLSSAEVFLYQVPLDQAVDRVRIDYCLKAGACPELILDWFELEKNFSFQSLKTFDPKINSSIAPCLSIPNTGITRCALRTSSLTTNKVSLTSTQGDSKYQSILRLETPFASGKHFLIRFRTITGELIAFEISGEKGGKRVSLPTQFFEVDQTSGTSENQRRIRVRNPVTPGLQDALGFVHATEELADK